MHTTAVLRAWRNAGIAVLTASTAAFAQDADDRCQTFDEAVSVDQKLSVAELRFGAMQQARNRLLQSLGVEVRGTTEILRGSTGDSTYTVMMQDIKQETTGWITRDTVLEWRSPDAGRSYVMKYHGCARTGVGKRDPAFFASVELDKDPPAYVDNGPGRRDSIVVNVRVSQPAFATVFFRNADTMTVLYPSVAVGAPYRAQLVTNGELRVPPPGNRLRTMITSGSRKSTQWIVVVITKQDVPLGIEPASTEVVALERMTWHEYLKWLNSIPMEDRFVREVQFTIERTR